MRQIGPMYEVDVWRGLFAHSSLEHSLSVVGDLIVRELGVFAVLVRKLELRERAVSTQAMAVAEPGVVVHAGRSACSNEQMERLLGFVGEVRALRGSPARDAFLALLSGGDESCDVVVAPLSSDEYGMAGALVLMGPEGTFDHRHEVEVARLAEPFSAALRSASRLQELERLREGVEADNRALLSKLGRQEVMGTIVGADAGFREVMTRVAQVAPTSAPVLLLGETGTGKEVAARAIHARSTRASGPMMRVNCGAIPPGLVDAELFGHERGSFTGATGARAGWFERADGGTLFLDEVGELPLAAQVRLLRVLQDGTLERVGGQRAVPVDVRIVAATHRDLGEMVAEAQFRQDLWYRVSVFPIWLPPLRDRREDIASLAEHFAWHAGKRLGGQPLVPSAADLELLASYDWPGNVRELASVIERAAILGNGKRLEIQSAIGLARPMASSTRPLAGRSEADGPLPSLDEAVRQHIEAGLTRTRGKIEGPGGAAELLGVNPHTLRSRMRKLGVRWQRFRR